MVLPLESEQDEALVEIAAEPEAVLGAATEAEHLSVVAPKAEL